MTVTKRIRSIVIGVVAVGVTAVTLAVASPASAWPVNDVTFGQVALDLHTISHDLNSVQAEGKPCETLRWQYIADSDYIGIRGSDNDILQTTKGAQLTFHGYSSADCSGQPASTVIRTFGDPDFSWLNGSMYISPWESN